MNLQNLLKIILIVIIVILIIRLFLDNSVIKESFQNDNISPRSNLVPVIRLKKSEDNTYDLIFDNKYNIEHIHIKTNILNTNQKYVVYYLDNDNMYNENFVMNNDEIEHPNRPKDTSGNLIIDKPRISGLSKPFTKSIKIKLLGEDPFNINKYYIYGYKSNISNTPAIIGKNINKKISVTNMEKKLNPNTGNHIYNLQFDQIYDIYGIDFNYDIENNSVETTQNKSLPITIHYESKLDDDKKVTYKLNNSYLSSDIDYSSNGFNSSIYFEKNIQTDRLFLDVPKKIILNGEDHKVIKLDNIKILIKHKENFNDSKSSVNNRIKENFQEINDYSPDELCPSLSGIENQMKLADSICKRIEYNDKIKNEKIKLERNKQYILKLKAQDEEIEQLERLINELHNNRDKRDTYNDALRLAKLQEQKKKVATIKELASKRLDHKNNNRVNVELSLVGDKPF